MSLEISAVAPATSEARVYWESSKFPAAIVAEIERQHRHRALALVPTLGLLPYPLLVAIKRSKSNSPFDLMSQGGSIARLLVKEKVAAATIMLDDALRPEQASPLLLGIDRGLYRFDRYKSGKSSPAPAVTLCHRSKTVRTALERAQPIAKAIQLCRDWINTPAEDMGPDELEVAARWVAKQAKLKIRVFDAEACAKAGMGALTAVGRASTRPPRMIVLDYSGQARGDLLALAGKGICFDTGGLDIKGADGMLLMKKDMGGAASVLAAAYAVGMLRPKRRVRFYLAAAENSIAGNAIRPGDVVRAMSGTTIEIGNTDAEGRLVLADAVALAVKEGADRIVDVATLTGAAMIALGRVRIPLLGNDERWLREIEQAADAAGEKVWRFPNDAEYREQIKGKLADLKNVGKGNEAGVIAGGLFIGQFAGERPWAHFDISPASWADGESELGPEGATGRIVPTLCRLAGAC